MRSDGRLAPVLSQEWGPGLVFWASPEEQTGEMISGTGWTGCQIERVSDPYARLDIRQPLILARDTGY